MPFKDIDFKRLDQAQALQNNLQNKIATISKLHDTRLSPKEKIATAELVSGKRFQPKVNPITDLVKQQEASQTLAPVISKIESLIHEQTEALENQHQALALPPAGPLPAIEGVPQGIDLYDRFQITDDDKYFYEQNRLTNLNELARTNDQAAIKETLKNLTRKSKSLGAQKSGIRRRPHPTAHDMDRLLGVEQDLNSISKYRNVLKKLQTGAGLPIGNYTVPLKRLKRDNIVSVRYGRSNKIVPAFGSTRVSDNVKHTLLGRALPLTAGERSFIDKLYRNASQSMTPSQAKEVRGSGVFTSVQEIAQRVQVLLGELQAGNTSIDLKNEVADLLHYLYKNSKISKASYTNLINSVI